MMFQMTTSAPKTRVPITLNATTHQGHSSAYVSRAIGARDPDRVKVSQGEILL